MSFSIEKENLKQLVATQRELFWFNPRVKKSLKLQLLQEKLAQMSQIIPFQINENIDTTWNVLLNNLSNERKSRQILGRNPPPSTEIRVFPLLLF